MPCRQLLGLVTLLCVTLTSVTACQTSKTLTYAISLEAACGVVLVPISYSREDALETRRQIVGHNATRDAFCLSGASFVDARYVCGLFSEIVTVGTDTYMTRREVVGFNAAYEGFCSEFRD